MTARRTLYMSTLKVFECAWSLYKETRQGATGQRYSNSMQ